MTAPASAIDGIHLVGDGVAVAELRTAAASAEQVALDLDVSSVRAKQDLLYVAARDLSIPHPVAGYDALLSLLSNLEWLDWHRGFLLVVRGLDQLRDSAADVFAAFVSLLPNVCDRWRTIGPPFGVVLAASGPTLGAARTLLDEANAGLARAALDPWDSGTRPATIVDRR